MTELLQTYVVAGCRPWSRRVFDERVSHLPGKWWFVSSPAELEALDLASLQPRYLFFTHWSWKIPPAIVRTHDCVCFHMTDLPYGRGGSPLQNLILRGHRQTKLTALRMVEEFDAGPIYAKVDLSLDGSAREIYERAASLSADLMEWMIRANPEPVPQSGDPVVFRRRQPEQSRLADSPSLDQLHDHIRMLDADGYPKAFLDLGELRLEFSGAVLHGKRLEANVTITQREKT